MKKTISQTTEEEAQEKTSKISGNKDKKSSSIALTKANNTEIKIKEEVASKKLDLALFIWSIISGIQVFISIIIIVSNEWLESKYVYVIIIFLVVYMLLFIGTVVYSFKNLESANKRMKNSTKGLKIFKSLTGIFYAVLTIVALIGVASTSFDSIMKVVTAIFMCLFLVVKFGLNIAKMIVKMRIKYVGKNYNVEISTFNNGVQSKKTNRDRLQEKMYNKHNKKE